MRSAPPRRPSQPFSLTRTSYQVGRPWMLEGKMLRGLTGTPMRMMDLAKSVLAEAEPEPFTFANLTTKSLTAWIFFMMGFLRGLARGGAVAAPRPRVGELEEVLLHVPGAGRAALRAHPAVQAHVLVLGHDAPGLEPRADVEVLRGVARRGAEPRAHLRLLAVGGEGDAVHGADVHAGVALDAQLRGEHGLHVAVEAALRLLPGELGVEAQLHLLADVLERDHELLERDAVPRVRHDLVVVDPLVDAHLLRNQVRHRRRAHGDVLALAEAVDGDGGVVAVGHGPDDVLGAERRVASEEDARQRRLQRLRIEHRHAPLVELDADVALDPGKGVLLAHGHQHLVAIEALLGLPRGHER